LTLSIPLLKGVSGVSRIEGALVMTFGSSHDHSIATNMISLVPQVNVHGQYRVTVFESDSGRTQSAGLTALLRETVTAAGAGKFRKYPGRETKPESTSRILQGDAD